MATPGTYFKLVIFRELYFGVVFYSFFFFADYI